MRRQRSGQAAMQQLRAPSPERQLHPLFQRQGVTGGQATHPGVGRLPQLQETLPQLQEAGSDDMPWPLASLAPEDSSAQPCEDPELFAWLCRKGRITRIMDVCNTRSAKQEDWRFDWVDLKQLGLGHRSPPWLAAAW